METAATPSDPLQVSCRNQWIGLAYLATCFYVTSSMFGHPRDMEVWRQLVLLVIATVMAAAVWEAGRWPRLCSHGSTAEAVRTLLQVIGDLLMFPLYAIGPAETPIIGYQRTPENLEILSRCPSMLKFHQTPWLRNTYTSFIALVFGDFVGGTSSKSKVRRETIETEDGGKLALDWWEEPGKIVSDPQKAKGVLLIGSTLTGEGLVSATRCIAESYAEKGWIVVVQVKRGCGFILPNTPDLKKDAVPPAPWCLSGLSDLVASVDHIAKLHPDLPLAAVGLSTGAAQLRHYANSMGKESKLSAIVCVDAGFEWHTGFDSIDRRVPLISKGLAAAAAHTFGVCGHPMKPVPEDIKGKVVKGGLMEFACNMMAPCHGFERSVKGGWAYTESCTPAHASGCGVPVLEMLTLQDTILDAETVCRVHSNYMASPHVMTVMTHSGTHMVRWEGWKPRCWVTRVSEEFIEAALKVVRDGVEPQTTATDQHSTSSMKHCDCGVPRTRPRTNSKSRANSS